MIGTRNHKSGFESESESTLFSLNPNPDSYFLALNRNPNPPQKARIPDSNPDLDLHITGPDSRVWAGHGPKNASWGATTQRTNAYFVLRFWIESLAIVMVKSVRKDRGGGVKLVHL